MKVPISPHPADVHVGQRLRLLRERQGLSHYAVAKALGVTFQQLYKYEAGINRISASRLWDIAGILGCEVGEFFEGLSAERTTVGLPLRPREGLAAVLDTPGGALLIESFLKMPGTVQAEIAALAAVLASKKVFPARSANAGPKPPEPARDRQDLTTRML